ncbi:MAG: VWA domain-containing protein [Planctomycetia bacterium]|nr:VWA domain-containing protein [Planctomycetia bacterium]
MSERNPTDRRLPVYLLLDCSGSMTGDPIAALQMGISLLVEELNSDPYAVETVWLSVITFASTADQAVPLTEIDTFHPPPLEAGGSTALGEALTLLAERIAVEVRTTTTEQKADWRPMVFLFTDGEPTDGWREPARLLREQTRADLIVCGAGPDIHDGTLRELSPTFVHLRDTAPGTLSSFLKWVTASVTAASKSLGAGRPVALPDLQPDPTTGANP